MKSLLLALLAATVLSMGATSTLQCRGFVPIIVQPDDDDDFDDDLEEEIEEIF